MIYFDDIDHWQQMLAAELQDIIPLLMGEAMAASAPEYVEDALELLLSSVSDRDKIIDATLKWICKTDIVGYHGTRLVSSEIASIREKGLIPLKALDRRDRLVRVLSRHPTWPAVANRLELMLQSHGPGCVAGHREDQVHLTLSKAGLTNVFNHYLTYGSEFDQFVANALLGAAGKELLATDGVAMIIAVAIPGELALNAAHPIFTIDDMRARGEVPNLVRELLTAWSYRLAHPEFQSRTLSIDCGMTFRSMVPRAWIRSIENY